MGTFKDIIDTVGSLQGEVADYISSTKQHHSLSKSAMEGVLNFPVIVSNTLSIEDASLISKALEKQFASFTLSVLTMNPYLSTMGGNGNAADYLKKYHQNLDTRVDSTDVLNAVNTFMQEASNRFDVDYEHLEGLSEHILYHVFEGVNYSGINKANLKFNYTISDVTDPKILNDFYNRRVKVSAVKETASINVDDVNIDLDLDIDTTALGRSMGRAMSAGNTANRTNPYGKNLGLMDNDAKKANELVPTLISMRIYPVDRATKTQLPPIDFVVGIKATLHPVSSDEMVVNIARGIKNENTFFNFIRFTTGEIKFFRDFVFSMNELKIDALNSSDKASRWWTMLKRRKALAKIKNIVLPQKLLPNATLVITQEELDMIKDQYGYDLSKPSLVYKLMENYFLISFVIVDPALQRVRFLFDGKNEYETLTYATLAREATTNDRQFKEMLNMLGRRM